MNDYREDVAHTIQNVLSKASTKSTIIPTIINEIDNYYKQGVLAYSEGINNYNLEIDKLQNLIDIEIKNKEKDEGTLLNIEQEIAIDARVLENLQDTFMQKINSIKELNIEYKELVDDRGYTKLLSRKTRELLQIQEELEALEITQLSHELERINSLHILEPKQKHIDSLKKNKKELILEKEHFASTKLHQLPLLGLTNTTVDLEKDDEIVDTDIV